jgi:hypothetical protein
MFEKQSQFLESKMCLSIYMKGRYEDFHAFERQKNKAKQSQSIRKGLADVFLSSLGGQCRD